MIVATAVLGQTDGSLAAHSVPQPPPQTYNSHTHSQKARWVKCLAQRSPQLRSNGNLQKYSCWTVPGKHTASGNNFITISVFPVTQFSDARNHCETNFHHSKTLPDTLIDQPYCRMHRQITNTRIKALCY